jgi:hypothetical protein
VFAYSYYVKLCMLFIGYHQPFSMRIIFFYGIVEQFPPSLAFDMMEA